MYQPKVSSKSLKGIYGFFRNRNHSRPLQTIDEERINEIIKSYCKDEHDLEPDLITCADLVQDNFDDFIEYVNHKK